MPHWTVDAPASLDFDAVTALRVRLIAGSVAVLATGDRPSVVVSDVRGRPLSVISLPASSAPAPGSAKVHAASHRELIETAIPAEG